MSDRPTALTDSGAVAGFHTAAPGVDAFLGIPFAAPPTGPLRWRAPMPPLAWDGFREAVRFGPAAPQMRPTPGLAEDEDCLTLNVWTGEGADRPVLLWIHGGRFAVGSTADPTFDGAALAARGLTVVTANYRLGVLGFLAHPELSAEGPAGASGNYGLLDQVAALRWIRTNVAAFGGNPGRVTVAGQSAGAASVLHLVNSPHARGLFHQAIALSGARHPGDDALDHLAPAYRRLDEAERDGAEFVREVGAVTADDLRARPWQEIVRDADRSTPGRTPPRFRPVLDGDVVPFTYAEALARPVNGVPVITGTTRDEDGAVPRPSTTIAELGEYARAAFGDRADEFLRLYPAASDAEAGLQRNAAARDAARCSTWTWACDWTSSAGSPVFTSFWTRTPPGDAGRIRGAHHESELAYVFANPADGWTAEDRAVAGTLSSYVANFVARGDPNGLGLPTWPAAARGRPVTMEIGDRWEPIVISGDDRRRFWIRHFEEGRRR